jgi:hypothetical protein
LRRALAAVALAPLLWLSAAAALADEPVSATLDVDRNVITIGDQIRVLIVVVAQPGYRLGAPVILKTLGDFDVIDSAPPLVANPTSGGTRYTFRYWITTFTVGDHVIPAVQFSYANDRGEVAAVRTTPIAVRVQTVIRDGESISDIKPLKPQLDLPGAETSRLLFWGSALTITAIVATPVLIVYRRRRRRGAAVGGVDRAPAEDALRELLRIAELRLPEKGLTAEHYRLVAATLRQYLARQFDLPADRRTARELRMAMERAGVDRRQTEALYELLRESEAVRFQQAQRQPRHAQQTLADAINAIGKGRAAQRRTAELVP